MMPRPISSASARGDATGRDASSTSPATRRAASATLGGGCGVGGAPAGSGAVAPGRGGETGARSAISKSESQLTLGILLGPRRRGSRGRR